VRASTLFVSRVVTLPGGALKITRAAGLSNAILSRPKVFTHRMSASIYYFIVIRKITDRSVLSAAVSWRFRQWECICRAPPCGQYREGVFLVPRLDLLKISALVPRIEVRIWIGMTFHPVECYDTDVARAHDILSQHLNAMI